MMVGGCASTGGGGGRRKLAVVERGQINGVDITESKIVQVDLVCQ